MRASSYLGAALCAALLTGCTREAALTPEQASAKGDAMLRQMSKTLAEAKTFSFTTEQLRERVRDRGGKVEERFSRRIIVRRPNGIAVADGGGHDGAGWYDGKSLTLVSNRDKAWARGPMPGSLDEAMDFVSAEYAFQMPMADLLYASPYDAVMTKDTKGGWVDLAKIGDLSCEHLSYQQPVVDWQIWLMQDDRRLPCQLEISYKTEPEKPVSRVTFSDWNIGIPVSDDTFTAKIPAGYERIKIMRHVTVENPKLTAAAAEADKAAAKKSR